MDIITNTIKSDYCIRLEFSTTSHLLHPRNERLIEELEALLEVAEKADDVSYIIINPKSPLTDFNIDWSNFINNDLLRGPLAKKIEHVRKVLQGIRSSKTPWIFIGEHGCLGSFFELALYCQGRIWFNTKCLVGLPELGYGFFPPLGALEIKGNTSIFLKNLSEFISIFHAPEAESIGLIQKCFNLKNWENQLPKLSTTFFPNILELKASQKIKKQHENAINNLENTSRLLKRIPIQETKRSIKATNHFWEDYQRFLRKVHHAEKSIEELDSIISNHAAKQFTSISYIDFLLNNQDKWVLKKSRKLNDDNIMIIDCSEAPPPKNSLKKIYNSRNQIIFYASNTNQLNKSLEIAYHRLSHLYAPRDLNNFWRSRVSWIQTLYTSSRLPHFKWDLSHNLTLSINKQRFLLHNLEEDFQSYTPTFYEFPSADFTIEREDLIQQTLKVSEGVIFTNFIGRSKNCISNFIKLVFLQELLALCDMQHKPIGAILEDLKESEWGQISSKDHWELYLSQNKTILDLKREELEELSLFINISEIKILDWNFLQNRRYVKRPQGVEKWNPTRISLHLGIFAGLLTRFLIAKNYCETHQAANFLTAKTLSFPINLGTPLGLLNRYGEKRLKYYISREWPLISQNFEYHKRI